MPSFDLPASIKPAFWGMVFVEGQRGAYFGIWPLWIEHVGAEIAVIGLLLGATNFLRMFIVGPSAVLADRFGARRILLATRLGLMLAFGIAFFSTHWVHLLPVILLLAAGEVVYPLMQSYVLRQSSEDQGMRSFALVMNVGTSLGMIVAPLLSAGVVALFGMRAAFALTAIFTALAFLSFARLESDSSPERGAGAPVSSYRTALAQRAVQGLLVLQAVMLFSLALGTSFIPTFVQDVRGVDPAGVALLSAFPAVGTAIFGLIIARSQVIQQQPLIGIAAGMMQVILSLALFHQFGHMAILVMAFFLRGGVNTSWAMIAGTIGKASRPADRTRSFAASEIVGGVFFALGPVVAGLLYSRRPELPFEASILLIAILIPILLFAQRRWLRQRVASVSEPADAPDAAGRHENAAPAPALAVKCRCSSD